MIPDIAQHDMVLTQLHDFVKVRVIAYRYVTLLI